MDNQKTKRPTLADPAEFAIVKSVYFPQDYRKEKLDPIEDLERTYSRERNTKNQAR